MSLQHNNRLNVINPQRNDKNLLKGKGEGGGIFFTTGRLIHVINKYKVYTYCNQKSDRYTSETFPLDSFPFLDYVFALLSDILQFFKTQPHKPATQPLMLHKLSIISIFDNI